MLHRALIPAPRLAGMDTIERLLRAFGNAGVAINWRTGAMRIIDPTTAANNFRGHFRDKLTITGTLTPGKNGCYFDGSNYAVMDSSLVPSIATAATLMSEYMLDAVTATLRLLISCDDNTLAEFIRISATNVTTDKPIFAITDNNASQATIGANFAAYVAGTTKRLAAAASLNSANAAFDGGTNGTNDISVTMPTPTTIRFGVRNSANAPLNGYMGLSLIMPARIDNERLVSLSRAA